MVFGRQYWIWIWYGIFLLGMLGLIASVYWGRRTHFKNREEIFRALGTILVSLGMEETQADAVQQERTVGQAG